MQFIKKNYEKVLLGVVLAGLVVIAVFLLILVADEKQAQEERRNKIRTMVIRPLEPPNLSQTDVLLKEAATPKGIGLSDNVHKLFNPERWLKPVTGPLIKSRVGEELTRLEVISITNLNFTVALQSVAQSPESGPRYSLTVEQQASPRPSLRPPIPKYASKGEKVVYGDKKEAFIVRDAQGPPENPTLILEFTDPEMTNSISIGKPYRRVDGYLANLKYAPENRAFLNKREGDKISVAQEEYTIVNISENEVMLQGKNQKKWPIRKP